MRTKVALFLLLLAVCLGGVGFAASVSLPGDRVYGLKRTLLEPMERLSATTIVAEARIAALQAERRLKEAEALASGNRLTPKFNAELVASFQDAELAMRRTMEDFAPAMPGDAAVLASHVQAIFAAHTVILRALSPLSPLLPMVEKAGPDLAAAAHNATLAIVNGRSSESEDYAKQALAEAKNRIEAATTALGSDDAGRLHLSAASDAAASAETEFSAGKYGPAFELAERAWRQATIFLITKQAADRYGIDVKL